ncbi:MAG: hypothetical protein IPL42_17510 [Saprospiraceae bacterium]|nr:hypothetical protein [Saprospiraceae bacterium]
MNPEEREKIKSDLEEKGLECGLRGTKKISLIITEEELITNKELVFNIFKKCEDFSSK